MDTFPLRQLKAIHTSTHPAQSSPRRIISERHDDDPETLFATLDSEAEDEA